MHTSQITLIEIVIYILYYSLMLGLLGIRIYNLFRFFFMRICLSWSHDWD